MDMDTITQLRKIKHERARIHMELLTLVDLAVEAANDSDEISWFDALNRELWLAAHHLSRAVYPIDGLLNAVGQAPPRKDAGTGPPIDTTCEECGRPAMRRRLGRLLCGSCYHEEEWEDHERAFYDPDESSIVR